MGFICSNFSIKIFDIYLLHVSSITSKKPKEHLLMKEVIYKIHETPENILYTILSNTTIKEAIYKIHETPKEYFVYTNNTMKEAIYKIQKAH